MWTRRFSKHAFFACLLPGLLLCAIQVPGALAEAGAIRVAERAGVTGDVVTLGSIARIEEGAEPVLGLERLVLGPAPAPGQTRIIHQDHVRGRMMKAGFDPSNLVFESDQGTSVFRQSIEITPSQISGLVEGYLSRNMPWQSGQSRIVDIRVSHGVVLPRGRITASIKEARGGDGVLGRVPLSITFHSDGAHEKKTWAVAQIEVMGEVVVARQSMKRRRPITEEDVELRKMDLGALPANVVVRLDDVIGNRATRHISEDAVLTADMVDLPPVIPRGAVVMVLAERGGLKMKTLGEVRENGRVGDLVKVMNLESRKSIYARVLDAQTVKVEF